MDIAKARIEFEIVEDFSRTFDLDLKFGIIDSASWAEPLGLRGLKPEKGYPLVGIERVNSRLVIVHYWSEFYPNRTVPYQLPERYADVVSDADIHKINSGQIKFNLIRKVKKNREDRFRYDHKNYTWDLALRKL